MHRGRKARSARLHAAPMAARVGAAAGTRVRACVQAWPSLVRIRRQRLLPRKMQMARRSRSGYGDAVGETVKFDAISGYLADGDGPGIVVLHEWWGLVPHITDVCYRFAALGFTALAP